MGTATALADETFDRLEDAAEHKAQIAIISKAPNTMHAIHAHVDKSTTGDNLGTSRDVLNGV